MRTPALRVLLCAAALLATEGARADGAKSGAPAASKSDEASQRFRSGVAFYKDRDFAAALVEFKRAYELVPNYGVLYNLGQTARELKDYAAALAAFDQYLREGGAKVPPARRREVQAALDDLRKKVGRIKVTINVDGAQILVDDVAAGVSPLADPVTVNVGRRKVSATSSGYTPTQRVVDVAGAGAGDTEVNLDLEKVASAAPLPPQPPPAPPGIPVYTWVTVSATGASLLVTAVLGGLAVSAHGSLESDLGKFPGDPTAIAADQSRTKGLANATDAFIGLTAVGAAATTVLFVLGPRLAKQAKPAPAVGVSPAGVFLRGAF